MTKIKSKSVSATKMAVATLALLAATGAAFILAPGTPGAAPNVLLPIADGFYRSWTAVNPAPGLPINSSRYSTVDEVNCNGATDHVTVSSVATRVSFLISTSTIPVGSTINSITISPCAAQSGSVNSPIVMNVFYRINNANSPDAGGYLLTGRFQNVPGTTFNMNTIMIATTSIEVGAVLATVPAQSSAQLSQISVQIDYTPAPPIAPSNLVELRSGRTDVNLHWRDNSFDEEGFTIYRDGRAIGGVGANVVDFVDANVASGSYTYTVFSYNKFGNSRQAASVFVIVVPPPGVITGTCNTVLTVTPGSVADRFTLAFSDPEGLSLISAVNADNGSVGGGTPPCLTNVRFGTVTITPHQFPIRALVGDCAHPANQCVISYP